MSGETTMRAAAPAEWRDDIQGMRALGSLLVAIFHIWVGGVSGGVDVFFVMAGYLMTKSALRDIDRNGRFDLAASWTRVALRLLPSLLVTLLAVILLTAIFVRGALLSDALKLISASAAYVHNWYLIWLGSHPQPRFNVQHMTQHFWAISLIGQAYIIVPLTLFVTERLSGEDGGAKRRNIAIVLCAIAVVSFVYGVVATARAPDAAYYNLLTRLWEFACGGLIAALPPIGARVTRGLSAAGSWLGVALLLIFGVLIGSWANMPGVVSLWPAASAVLVLVCGRPDDPANASLVLAWRPLVWLGGLSYGIYLWHWPLTVTLLDRQNWAALSLVEGCGIILAAIALSAATQALARRAMARDFVKAAPRRAAFLLIAILAAISLAAVIGAGMV